MADSNQADTKVSPPAADIPTALKTLRVTDVYDLPKYPCARHSLLMGIGSGVGVLGLRLIRANAWSAANWAVGTFVFISISSWELCQQSRKKELETMRTIVEKYPHRHVKEVLKKTETARGGNQEGTS